MANTIFRLKIEQNGVEAIISVTANNKIEAREKFKKLGFPAHVDWIFN